jgi:hypothetical protein
MPDLVLVAHRAGASFVSVCKVCPEPAEIVVALDPDVAL